MGKNNKITWITNLGILFPSTVLLLMLIYYLDVRSRAGAYEGILISYVFYISVFLFVFIIIEEYKKAVSIARDQDNSQNTVSSKEKFFSPKQLFMVIATIIYIPTLQVLGFVVSTFVYLMVMQKELGITSWKTRFFISLGVSIGIDLVFRLIFQINLPSGLGNIGTEVFTR